MAQHEIKLSQNFTVIDPLRVKTFHSIHMNRNLQQIRTTDEGLTQKQTKQALCITDSSVQACHWPLTSSSPELWHQKEPQGFKRHSPPFNQTQTVSDGGSNYIHFLQAIKCISTVWNTLMWCGMSSAMSCTQHINMLYAYTWFICLFERDSAS